MNINLLTPASPAKLTKTNFNTSPVFKGNVTAPKTNEVSFFGSIPIENLRRYTLSRNAAVKNYSHTEGRVQKDQYEKLIKEFPDSIKAIDKILDGELIYTIKPEQHAKAALLLNNCVEPNSRVLAVGTSPASIANIMELLGQDVVYLPISHFRSAYETYFNYNPDPEKNKEEFCPKTDNLKTCSRYLASKGIEGDCEGKKIYVMDYSLTGNTIKNMKTFLKHFNGLEDENIVLMSVLDTLKANKMLASCDEKFNRGMIPSIEDIDNLQDQMFYGTIGRLSSTPHFGLEINRIDIPDEEIFYDFEHYTNPLARQFVTSAYDKAKKIQSKALD